MNFFDHTRTQTRRHFFNHVTGGIETIALANLLALEGRTAERSVTDVNPLAPKRPHFAPKAKDVIFLFMAGAPSQIDLFDPKPALQKWHGQPLPESMTRDMKMAFIKPTATVMASPRKFAPCGQSGIEISDWLPQTRTIGDEICVVRSMYSEAFNHHPGQALLMSGHTQLMIERGVRFVMLAHST